MDRVAAMVLAGGRGLDFGALSEQRTKAAFPLAGSYRIIDCVLSNLSHSAVRHVGIVIQFLPAPLIEHIGSGRTWDYDMADRSLRILTPFVGVSETRWFHGTGDAIAKNINLFDNEDVTDVLILSGDHVYQMDYRRLLDHHRATGADLTVACVEIPPDQQHPRFGNVVLGEGGRVAEFLEKPVERTSPLVSMGIYCFRREVLVDLVEHYRPSPGQEAFHLASDLIQPCIAHINAHAWIYHHPWFYLGNIREYYDFHMALARGELRLFDAGWNVITNFSDRQFGSRGPAWFGVESQVSDSIVSPGCAVEGTVEGSVLSPGVRIGAGAVVRDSILFHDVVVAPGAHIFGAILDKDVRVGEGARIGEASLVEGAITVIPKGCHVSAGETIEAGANLEAAVHP